MDITGVQPPTATPPAAPDWGTLPAGFWIRFVAVMVDGAILGFILFIVMLPVSSIMLAAGYVPGESQTLYGPKNLVTTLIYATIEAAFLSGRWQATPGKRIMGIVIIGEDGGRLTFGRAFCRYLAKILSAVILFVGFIMAAFMKDKAALHDLICSTRVIHGKK